MSGSMGSIMMNWTSELLKQTKKRKRQQMKIQLPKQKDATDSQEQTVQTEIGELSCEECQIKEAKMSVQREQLSGLEADKSALHGKFVRTQQSLGEAMERETKLRSENEVMALENAQSKYELKELRLEMEESLLKSEQDHEHQIQVLEQVMTEKDTDWKHRQESLHQDLQNALRTNIDLSNFENMSRTQLEQEIGSLRTVIDLRLKEIHELRRVNGELSHKLERHYWLENELSKTRHRVEEMNLVIQNKMVAEKELIDMTEGLTNDLAKARNEILTLKRNLENKQFIQSNQEFISPALDQMQLMQHRNQHQKLWEEGW
ncbi:hypothetical protein TCAL_12120 [Tigriopus californicus]|uniref:Uncharacterized protein n=1 Tax=Tigriopus californicus TaxID=6832 RepID=A0A553PDD7_TIGCA|nr:pericentrin-like isoform X2 [Tigriopus californicus]TRY75698.1 hypothetical protein TCAL_12120 [Tigriopus californicus]